MKRPRPPLAPGDHRHGKATSYNNHGCRCEDCTDAWAAACRNRQRNRWGRRTWAEYVADQGGRTHGIRATYQAGCRCRPCTDAERDYRAEYRTRQALSQPVDNVRRVE